MRRWCCMCIALAGGGLNGRRWGRRGKCPFLVRDCCVLACYSFVVVVSESVEVGWMGSRWCCVLSYLRWVHGT